MASLELEVVGGAGTSASCRPRLAGFTEVGERRHFAGFLGGEQLLFERLNRPVCFLASSITQAEKTEPGVIVAGTTLAESVSGWVFFFFNSCVLFFLFKPTAV